MIQSLLGHRSIFGCLLLFIYALTACTPAGAEPRRYALIVGVREYPVSDKLTPLAFTEPDADQLAATLKQGGFNVTLMTQTASRAAEQERLNPNAALIRKQFRDLVGEPFLVKEDCLLVILEGHGIQLPSRANAETPTYYFCPGDAQIDDLKFSEEVQAQHNLIPVQEFYDLLKQSSAGVKLLVVDACRNDPNKVDNFRSGNSVTRPPVPDPPGGTAALFSCSANQRAAEDPDLKHGVFSHFLIEALGGKGDLDGDQQIDLTELHKYVGSRTYTHVREKFSTQQLPEFKGEIKGWAPLLSLNAARSVPTLNPKPLPNSDKFAGAKAGEVLAVSGIKFCWCPPGKFTMGSPTSEVNRLDEREDQASVTITKGFYLGQYEVTQAEWESIMGTTPWKGETDVKEGDSYPATYVSWEDASEFCTKLTAKAHRERWLPKDWKIDLPTEAQWEYACRAGTTSSFSFGDDELQLVRYAWFDVNARHVEENSAHLVGLKKANPWQLYDMHGNVCEWCRDWYRDHLPGGIDPDVQNESEQKALRNGSWYGTGADCRSAHRDGFPPDSRIDVVGFRVAVVQSKTP